MSLTIGSLFSGVGGLELGLERAGLGPVVWQAESDEWRRRVLAKHWPNATRYADVREVNRDAARVGLVCGGFPCQDLSSAHTNGQRRGLDGERSGLWGEFVRVLRDLRPPWVVAENVSTLLHGGLGRVLGDLAELGYDAQWTSVSACAVGAPHTRRRVFVVAHAHGRVEPTGPLHVETQVVQGVAAAGRAHWRQPPPRALGVADGLPGGLDGRRLAAMGNAVVPHVAELIGRAILEVAA